MTSSQLTLAMFVCVASAVTGCDRTPTVTAQPADEIAPTPSAPPAPVAVVPERIIESTFDDIKFEMEKTDKFERTMLTPKVEDLVGRRIRIRGYIYPTMKKRGLKQFVLVRDNLECCFGPGAALFDCIVVDMNEGKTAEFTIRPVAVEGTFRFEEMIGYDNQLLGIYRLDGEAVE